jgi:phage-related protein
MAADFPGSPSNGDTYVYNGVTYVYNAVLGVWTIDAGAAGGSSSYGEIFIVKIPADSISGGVPLTDSFYTFDRGLSRATNFNILRANFGDGYEQRAIDGTNSKKDMFGASFSNRTKEDINIIAKFLDVHQAKTFDIIIPEYDGNQTIKVVCEGYNIKYMYHSYHSLTAEFRRVYEP